MDSLRLLEQRIRPDFRKAVTFGILALAALIVGSELGEVRDGLRRGLIAYGCALLTAVFGVVASRTAASEVHRVAAARAGTAAAAMLRLLVQLGGYLIVAFSVFDLIGVGLQHLLVGSAVTGVILGLAAQPVLSNLFAGLVLLFSRPYVTGERVRVMSGALNGPLTGTVISAGLLYTMLETDDGPLNIPNSALMASAVGPAAEAAAEEEAKPDEAEPETQGAAAGAIGAVD
ncbi:mechanosensitive ion channel domain-containing protein [Winogradskya consettensis]|uniref:mechanosensitive ion channel domain-containing protein n=1 Tax=Winogradskya consettensis TaxID=113560 RepID=UPI001FD2F836|nr:mechanosensitive ion channel family protein [Actinoplanes consettensis]